MQNLRLTHPTERVWWLPLDEDEEEEDIYLYET
jgi:hypothetical protein